LVEKATAKKGTHTRHYKVPTSEIIEQQEYKLIKNIASDSDSDQIVVV